MAKKVRYNRNHMVLIMLSLGILSYALLVVLAAFKPNDPKLSAFEQRRREAAGDPRAKEALRRERLIGLAMALRLPATSLLVVLMTACLIVSLGWKWGIVSAIAAVVLYGRIASLSLFAKLARKLFARRESALIGFLTSNERILRLLAGKPVPRQQAVPIGSIEELHHAIETSQHILTADDKKLVMGAIGFRKRRVSEIMTERSDIVSVEQTELLGPLVLSDLHKTGHSCFPVINKDLDHVVGMLDTRSQFALEAKRSLTAAKTMTPKVFTVQGDESLDRALAAFVHTRHHLLMVSNSNKETIGLISLGDVLEALFGERIADVSPTE